MNSSICFLPIVIDLEVVLREFLGPADLSRTQALYLHRMPKVIIIADNKNCVFTPF